MYYSSLDPEITVKLPRDQQKLVQMYNAYPLDRFGYMPNAAGFDIHPDSLFKPYRCLDDYGTVCDRRAKELLELDRHMYVYWSGGIDSTAVMVALLRAGATSKEVTVVLDRKSMIENRPFYEQHLDKKFQTMRFRQAPEMLYHKPGALLVTGELNDHLNGTEGAQRVIWTSGIGAIMAENTPLNFAIAMGGLGWAHEDALALHANIMGSAANAGVVLARVFDAMWWICFAFKWQHVLMRMFTYGSSAFADQLSIDSYKNVAHFFNTVPFQAWAVTGHEKRLGENWSEYKIVCKRYVYRYTEDEAWLKHAVKIASLRDQGPDLKTHIHRFPPVQDVADAG